MKPACSNPRLFPLLLPVFLALVAGCNRTPDNNAEVLAEFRGPNYLPPGQRRLAPGAPPLVPHKVYGLSFGCAKCHNEKNFTFAGHPVPWNPHPERVACLQCHVSQQLTDEPFRFDGLRKGAATTASATIAR